MRNLKWIAAFVSLSLSTACSQNFSGMEGLFGETDNEHGLTIESSSEQSPFLSASNLFDAGATRPWLTKRFPFFPEWIEFSYPEPVSMGEFKYIGLAGRPNSAPKDFSVLAMVDGSWREALRVPNGCISTDNPVRSWTLHKEVKSRHFRLEIRSNCGDNEYVGLQKIHIDRFYRYARKEEWNPKGYYQIFPTLPPSGKAIASSEINSSNAVRNLFDDNPQTVWHREVDNIQAEPESWLTIDLGATPKPPAVAVAMYPNINQPIQFFDTAIVQGSQNGGAWEDICKLRMQAPPEDGQEQFWTFENDKAYRHYRVLLPSGYAGGTFYSMSELKIFAAGADPKERLKSNMFTGVLKPENLLFPLAGNANRVEGGTVLRADTGVDKLFDGNADTVWHVDVAAAERGDIPWVVIDMGEGANRPVRIVSASPNPASPIQFLKQATLEGSNDANEWTMLAYIKTPVEPLDGSGLSWRVNNDQVFRYYRLSIPSGFAGGSFMSMSELRLYAD